MSPRSENCRLLLSQQHHGFTNITVTVRTDCKGDTDDLNGSLFLVLSALFCLPKKCGTTSYQRALSAHLTNLITTNPTMKTYADKIKPAVWSAADKNKFILEKIGNEKISSDDLTALIVYKIMSNFQDFSLVNPMTFVKKNNSTVPIYPPEEQVRKRVINTRNPFSRLNAAWRDKFRERWYKRNTFEFQEDLADLKPSVDRAELPDAIPPSGYVNSFHGFLRYVNQEDGERHLNTHWKSISLQCQPCRFVYDYIMDIETAKEDSEFVFGELGFETKLPKVHTSSKNDKNSLEDYYKGQGCSYQCLKPASNKDPDGEIENSGKKHGKSRIPNFCYIQVIVFDLKLLVAAVGTKQVRYHEKM